jgi:chromosome segregation ATPase
MQQDIQQLKDKITQLEASLATMKKGDVPGAISELLDARGYITRLKGTISSLENHRDQLLCELNTLRARTAAAAKQRAPAAAFGEVTDR